METRVNENLEPSYEHSKFALPGEVNWKTDWSFNKMFRHTSNDSVVLSTDIKLNHNCESNFLLGNW
jgi:hypothetical protein